MPSQAHSYASVALPMLHYKRARDTTVEFSNIWSAERQLWANRQTELMQFNWLLYLNIVNIVSIARMLNLVTS